MESSLIFLAPQDCYIEFPERTQRFRYTEVPELREKVQQFVQSLVEEHRNDFFGDRCGRCGNSCRRSDVLVREQEILPLQQHLGLRESGFREKYLSAAATWNPGDGFMKLQNGACPFLKGGDGTPQSAICTIHDIRPQSCRDYRSDKPSCRKDTGHLLEEVAEVWLDPEHTRIVLQGGTTATFASTGWAELSQLMTVSEPSDPHRYERVAREVKAMLEMMIQELPGAVINDVYRENLKRLRRLTDSLAGMQHLSTQISEGLEETWTLLRRLERSVDAPVQTQPFLESTLDWLYLEETGLQFRATGRTDVIPLAYPWAPRVHKAATGLLKALLQQSDDALQEALGEKDPPCYMCGECCGFYAIEVQPSDITRLIELLPVTREEFIEEYTVRQRFTWNSGARILKKAPATVYSKDLKSLRVLGQEEGHTAQRCVFLERKDDGFFYCGVHSHKPDACRAYQPTHALCRNTNQRENWGRQLKSLRALEADATCLSVHPHDGPTLRYARGYWPEVEFALRALANELNSL